MDELEFYNGQWTGQEIDARILKVDCGTISALPATITNANILSKHIYLHSVMSNPYAFVGNCVIDTSNGSLTISGTISGSTTLVLYLMLPL